MIDALAAQMMNVSKSNSAASQEAMRIRLFNDAEAGALFDSTQLLITLAIKLGRGSALSVTFGSTEFTPGWSGRIAVEHPFYVTSVSSMRRAL